MSDDYYYSGLYAEEQAEAETQQPVAWITPGGDVSRSLLWCLERCLPGEQPRPLYATQQPAVDEEIMVNTPYDVYILPLQPSGLTSGPRFVVHVPGPEQPTARPPKPTECMNGCPDRQVCDHCQWPPGPDQQPTPPSTPVEVGYAKRLAADPHSTHRVWRGDDWQPCYCEATNDHRIGSEQPTAVDEAMVERACRHWYTHWDTADRATKRFWAKTMRDLLTAALDAYHKQGDEK